MFYQEIRLLGFISKMLYYSAIEYDKKLRSYLNTHQLVVDKPMQADAGQTGITLKDVLPTNEPPLDELMIEDEISLEEIISDRSLSKAVNMLTEKEKMIIQLAYIQAKTDREIGKQLNISHQAVCKTRNKALTKIRTCMEGNNDV